MQDSAKSVLSYFELKEQPFAPTADPSFFCATQDHKECLFRLWTSIDERQGIAVVLGHYGTGKTTLLRKILSGMRAKPEQYNTAVIASPIPSWTSFALLEAVVTQFGLNPRKRSFVSYMEALYQYLLQRRHHITTLIIDDAQNLNKRGQLELLRLVQNLETPRHKLINLVFFAQMEWMPVLRAAPNFEQRINTTYTVGPLSPEETKRLIDFRLRQAGAGPRGPVFDENAVRVLHTYAEGSPRVTVNLCRNALVLAAQLRTRRISQAIILHTIQKTTLPDRGKNARVAAVLNEEMAPQGRGDALEEAAPRTEAQGNVHVQTARKANELLLKAAKSAAAGFHDVES